MTEKEIKLELVKAVLPIYKNIDTTITLSEKFWQWINLSSVNEECKGNCQSNHKK